MPFIPHTDEDIRAMLAAIGVADIEALFDEIPATLRGAAPDGVPGALDEAQLMRLAADRAAEDARCVSFLGAGAYEHHIPAAVWQIATRGEFYSSYTPYQAEASQGTLQLLYEYQSMMTSLTGLEVTNASLYDGASALAEAILMAVRLARGPMRVLVPRTVNPAWRRAVRTLVRNQRIEIVEVAYDAHTGQTSLAALEGTDTTGVAALVIPQPGFLGVLEPVDALVAWARDRRILTIAAVNPLALALLVPPGTWGGTGVDIAVGDGQPLGIPLSGGGPYYGFMATRMAHVRQMPGRLVGRTTDRDGRTGFTLTLQAREQHIRRSKATSNICTNQGLMVTASTIHMALLGPDGLRRVAARCHANTLRTLRALADIPGVRRVFDSPLFHEGVLRFDVPVAGVLRALEAKGILGGLRLRPDYPELGESLLVCATEARTDDDIALFATHVARIVGKRLRPAPDANGSGSG
jgi:glycine dehydrogenase subunit 1